MEVSYGPQKEHFQYVSGAFARSSPAACRSTFRCDDGIYESNFKRGKKPDKKLYELRQK